MVQNHFVGMKKVSVTKKLTEMIVTIPKTVGNIGGMLSNIHSQTQQENRRVLLKILEMVRYLGRQGIAFRGRDELESNLFNCLSF